MPQNTQNKKFQVIKIFVLYMIEKMTVKKMHSLLLASVEVMEFHITVEHSKLRPNKVQYSNRRLYRVENLGSKLTSANPNCLRKCVIHVQVKIQFGVHIRGFTQFVVETEQAGFYGD